MESDRNLSQYSIARGDRSLFGRLSQRNSSGKRVPRSNTAPPGGLPVVHEAATKVSDWRQRFIEVGMCCMHSIVLGNDGRKPLMQCNSGLQGYASW